MGWELRICSQKDVDELPKATYCRWIEKFTVVKITIIIMVIEKNGSFEEVWGTYTLNNVIIKSFHSSLQFNTQ